MTMAIQHEADAQATVNDFSDFTDHASSAIHRSFNLLARLRAVNEYSSVRVHELAADYSNLGSSKHGQKSQSSPDSEIATQPTGDGSQSLPTPDNSQLTTSAFIPSSTVIESNRNIGPGSRLSSDPRLPRNIRRELSENLNVSLIGSANAVEEAKRITELVGRLRHRIRVVKSGLQQKEREILGISEESDLHRTPAPDFTERSRRAGPSDEEQLDLPTVRGKRRKKIADNITTSTPGRGKKSKANKSTGVTALLTMNIAAETSLEMSSNELIGQSPLNNVAMSNELDASTPDTELPASSLAVPSMDDGTSQIDPIVSIENRIEKEAVESTSTDKMLVHPTEKEAVQFITTDQVLVQQDPDRTEIYSREQTAPVSDQLPLRQHSRQPSGELRKTWLRSPRKSPSKSSSEQVYRPNVVSPSYQSSTSAQKKRPRSESPQEQSTQRVSTDDQIPDSDTNQRDSPRKSKRLRSQSVQADGMESSALPVTIELDQLISGDFATLLPVSSLSTIRAPVFEPPSRSNIVQIPNSCCPSSEPLSPLSPIESLPPSIGPSRESSPSRRICNNTPQNISPTRHQPPQGIVSVLDVIEEDDNEEDQLEHSQPHAHDSRGRKLTTCEPFQIRPRMSARLAGASVFSSTTSSPSQTDILPALEVRKLGHLESRTAEGDDGSAIRVVQSSPIRRPVSSSKRRGSIPTLALATILSPGSSSSTRSSARLSAKAKDTHTGIDQTGTIERSHTRGGIDDSRRVGDGNVLDLTQQDLARPSFTDPILIPTLSRRRTRRPVPGAIVADMEAEASAVTSAPATTMYGLPLSLRGNKISLGKRKTAPAPVKKMGGGKMRRESEVKEDPTRVDSKLKVQNEGDEGEQEEEVNENEPTYCSCNQVSWGVMIACENEDCEKEWFHLPCVGLGQQPPRRAKWYCPACRVLLGVDERGNAAAAS